MRGALRPTLEIHSATAAPSSALARYVASLTFACARSPLSKTLAMDTPAARGQCTWPWAIRRRDLCFQSKRNRDAAARKQEAAYLLHIDVIESPTIVAMVSVLASTSASAIVTHAAVGAVHVAAVAVLGFDATFQSPIAAICLV